jgi:hypothetical protein
MSMANLPVGTEIEGMNEASLVGLALASARHQP